MLSKLFSANDDGQRTFSVNFSVCPVNYAFELQICQDKFREVVHQVHVLTLRSSREAPHS